MHLSPEALQQLLRAEDAELLTADAAALGHLEQCPECQQRLAECSGEQSWFAHLSDELRAVHDQTEPEDWEAAAAERTVAWDPAEQIEISTDFLPPALHPELLGRLGRYDIEQTIGAGGFGIVFKAYDTELRRVVALKVLAPHLMSSGAARKRFTREAQAAAAIMHEHVVPIYDVVNQNDTCYLVMQYIAGPSLQERVDRHGPLTVAEVLRVGVQIAAGLHAAHQQGLVHRDVKPGNILLEESVDRVLISDFGLARTADDANLTRSGAITGTPHYMSPEQASGAAIDARSDLFSLGSVLYFACTGRPAFRAPQIMAVLNRICHYPHRRVTEVNAEIPGPLADLIDRLLAKTPADRYPSAAEVEQQLLQLLADWQSGKLLATATGSHSTGSQSTGSPSTGSHFTGSPSTGATATTTLHRRGATALWKSLLLAAALLGFLGLGIWWANAPRIAQVQPPNADPTPLNPDHDSLANLPVAAAPTPSKQASPADIADVAGDATATSHSAVIVEIDSDAALAAGTPLAAAPPPRLAQVLRLHWNTETAPLEWEIEETRRAWAQQDMELDIWIDLLQEAIQADE